MYKPFLYSQNDPTWKHDRLGLSRTSTVGRYGCLLVSFAMIAQASVTWMNQCRAATGGFAPGSAMAANFDIVRCAPGVKLIEVRPANSLWTKPVPLPDMQDLYDHLASGMPAILEVDWRGDAAGTGHRDNQHFVVATYSVEELMHINDPWDGVVKTLTPRYGSTNAKAIWRYLLYAIV